MPTRLISSRTFSTGLLLLSLASASTAHAGSGTSGGGQDTVAAFNQNVLTLVNWLQVHGDELKPKVSPREFYLAADPSFVLPVNDSQVAGQAHSGFAAVTKQCNGQLPSDPSDLRTACYSQNTKTIYLSESRYSLQANPTILGITAHEVFRKMGLETDAYEVSRQINIVSIPGVGGCCKVPSAVIPYETAFESAHPLNLRDDVNADSKLSRALLVYPTNDAVNVNVPDIRESGILILDLKGIRPRMTLVQNIGIAYDVFQGRGFKLPSLLDEGDNYVRDEYGEARTYSISTDASGKRYAYRYTYRFDDQGHIIVKTEFCNVSSASPKDAWFLTSYMVFDTLAPSPCAWTRDGYQTYTCNQK